MEPNKDPPKKDLLAELDLPALFQRREEAVKTQKKTAAKVQNAQFFHISGFWLSGCAMLLAAILVRQTYLDNEPAGVILLSACGTLCIGLWTAIFFPTLTVRRRQDEAKDADKKLKDIETKIAFCNLVQEEARQLKVRKYAEAWVAKDL